MSSHKTQVDPDVAEKLLAFRGRIATTAEEIVFKIFPAKILELQAWVEETNDVASDLHISQASSSTDTTIYPAPAVVVNDERSPKKRKRTTSATDAHSNGGEARADANPSNYVVYSQLIHANAHVRKVHLELKKEFEELIDLCDKVKLWVNLTMPKIEDGDNFGVQIQEEALNELHRAQESGYNLRDACRTHHLTRAKIAAKLIKYPNIEDYALALQDHDEKQLFMARQHLIDLRNVYAILTDILHKNIQKIRAPKGNNSASMY